MSDKNDLAISVLNHKVERLTNDIIESEREKQRHLDCTEREKERIIAFETKRDNLLSAIEELTEPIPEEVILEETTNE